jgi:acetyl-CoA acetyltransferase
VLFAAAEDAASLAPRPAWVLAAVTAHDQQYMGDSPKRLAEMRSLLEARWKGYAHAGIEDPVRDFDVAEIYEPATYAELAMYECLVSARRRRRPVIDAACPSSTGRCPEPVGRSSGEPCRRDRPDPVGEAACR